MSWCIITIKDLYSTIPMNKLTHFNPAGEAHMVDVGDKAETQRVAVAEGHIAMQPDTLKLIEEGGHKKGDVLGVARIAGIMAAIGVLIMAALYHLVLS